MTNNSRLHMCLFKPKSCIDRILVNLKLAFMCVQHSRNTNYFTFKIYCGMSSILMWYCICVCLVFNIIRTKLCIDNLGLTKNILLHPLFFIWMILLFNSPEFTNYLYFIIYSDGYCHLFVEFESSVDFEHRNWAQAEAIKLTCSTALNLLWFLTFLANAHIYQRRFIISKVT